MIGSYNPWLVILSVVVAAMASYTALDLARRVTTTQGSAAIVWLLGGACAMGTGIWSMHFVGMLAFSLPIAMAYHVTTTLISMVIAVVVSAFALYVVSRRELSVNHFIAGGILMGLGISAMHYTGMAAMDMWPSISYDAIRVIASVAIAIAASLVALLIAMKLPQYEERIARPAQGMSALAMGLAIAGMHYTAMSAARFAPNTICLSGTSVNNAWLAGVIALVTFTILSITLLLSMLDSRYKQKTGGLTASLNASQLSLDQAHQQLRHLALHDALTNLPNRTLLEERLTEVIQRTKGGDGFCALMFLDLDRFKIVNDSLGHQAGDEVLQEVARRIRSRVRHDDTVSRIGGDEFVVLVFRIDRPDDAAIVAQKLLEAFEAPIRVHGAEIMSSVSIGISVAPEDGVTVDDLMAHADVAMYHAKKQGRNNYQFYRRELNEFAGKRLALENGLRRAIADQQFELWYQPKINMGSGEIVGLEALVRWRHPERGLIPPLEFIPLAEETGLITQLGTWVIQTACRQNRIWRDAGLPKLRIAVNVSAAQFRQPTLPRIILDALNETQLEPESLELEVTESVVMSNPEEAVLTLDKIRQMGVHISIDDFGTGYSSLSYLKKFPIDTLKVDRSFIRDVIGSSDDAAIVKAIVALAQSLKLNIVAEGVEDAAQLSFLNALGCDEYQGYYFSRPVPAADIAGLLPGKASAVRQTSILEVRTEH
jgi:diguanylate cyclase